MSHTSASEKVSFTIRRPTPVSRASSGNDSDSGFKVPALPRHLTNEGSTPGSPLARSARSSPKRTYAEVDSSDEEDEDQIELVTGFDQFGVQRLHEKKKQPEGPLVIPALKNKDWRDLARKRKQIYLPPSAAATTGADGSVGGLGTRDTINSGPQLSGLQMSKRPKLEDGTEVKMEVEEQGDVPTARDASEEAEAKEEELTEDQKAIRAILAAAKNPNLEDEPQIDIIPVSEEDALRQDLIELPDSATLDDYERVPVSQFGAALLRGMGWTDGTAASRKKGADGKPKGLVEPWLPQARPTLLGIGAKEKEVFDDGSGKAGKKFRPDKKYMPLLKVEKNGSRNGSEDRDTRSGSSSRRRSPSPSYSSSKRSSRRSPSPDRRRDRDRYDSDNRRRDDYKNRDRDGERKRDGDRDRDRRRDYESNSSRKDRDRDGDRRRDRSSERHRDSSSRRRDY